MNPRSWLRSLLSDHSMRFPGSRASRSRSRRMSARAIAPRLEVLEDRWTPATISISDATMNEIGTPSPFVSAGSGGLDAPAGITRGPDGNLYVAGNGGAVLRYSGTTGQFISTFVPKGSGGLADVNGITFGPDGHLYISNGPTDQILRFNGATGAPMGAFVSAGSGGLDGPWGLTFGPDGNLYVNSNLTDEVLRYEGPLAASPGQPLPASGNSGATFAVASKENLLQPRHLLFGPDGNLYVGGIHKGVSRFDGATGDFLDVFIPNGRGGLSTAPRGLAFDREGRLHAVGADNGVYRYDSAGNFLGHLVSGVANSPSTSIGIAFDARGALWMSSRDLDTVVRYDRGVVVTLSAASATPVSVQYATAEGQATSASDFVADAGTITFQPGETVRHILLATKDDVVLESNETFSVTLTNASAGNTIGDASALVTILDDDSARQVAIADSSATEGDRTPHYRGAFLQGLPGVDFTFPAFWEGKYYGGTLQGPGADSINRYDAATGALEVAPLIQSEKINNLRDIVFLNGHILAQSENTDEILRFDAATGAFVDVFVPANSGGIDNPHGMVVGPDWNGDGVPEIYATGRVSRNVVRYDGATGAPLGTLDTSGAGSLNNPQGIAHRLGTIYVANTLGNQIKKYDAQTGSYLGIAASTHLTRPSDVDFGPDGLMYVSSDSVNRILRFTVDGVFVDDFVPPGSGGMVAPYRIAFGPDGNLFAANTVKSEVMRFGTESEVLFTVSISAPSTVPLTVNFATANGSALDGSDFASTTGTVTFEPGVTSKIIRVPTLDDAIGEAIETFTVTLSNASGATIADGQAAGTIVDNDPKFYVVNDAATDQIYRYGPTGASQATTTVGAGNTAPRGAASNVAGDRLWVADANRNVYVYNPAGTMLGSWTAGSLASNAQVEGIATNGTDIWIVDARQDKVFQYAGAANRLTGSQNAASTFNLASGNNNPKGIVTDGTSIWVVNDGSTDKVFKYTMAGALLGSWTITGAGSTPTGITLDPTGPTTLWIVDSGTDRVYEFAGALGRVSGSQSPSASFALAAGNTNPQDIADPPGASSSSIVTSTTLTSISLNPASPRTPLTFTATVTGGSDGDIVELHDNTSDGAVVATGVLAGGSATLTIPANTLTAGTHELVAVYAGDGLKAPSVSNSILQVIDGRPNIVSIAPFSGPTTGGTVVVITGTNLDGATAVAFGPNSAASFTVNSATQITATAPAAAGTGVVDIVVTTPDGSSTTTGTADDFTYALPAPKLGSMMPNGGEMYARNAYGIQVAGLAGNHSIITQLFVTFDIGVTLDPGAFTLDAGHVDVNTAGSVGPVPQGTNVVGIIAEPDPNSLDANGGFKSYRLRFSGSSTYLNSFDNSATGNGGLGNSFTTLKDGFYTLNINGANVHAGNSVSGTPMVGNASQSFWTMYASHAADDRSVSTTPGDGSSAIGVNSSLIDFAKTNGDGYGGGNLAEYNANFDWNLDGDVRDDVIEFANRFGAEWRF